jgi:hypothetical protein
VCEPYSSGVHVLHICCYFTPHSNYCNTRFVRHVISLCAKHIANNKIISLILLEISIHYRVFLTSYTYLHNLLTHAYVCVCVGKNECFPCCVHGSLQLKGTPTSCFSLFWPSNCHLPKMYKFAIAFCVCWTFIWTRTKSVCDLMRGWSDSVFSMLANCYFYVPVVASGHD